ncbi:MAG: transcriptional regulator [Betaproteobacteria bacterium]|jgi:prophage regulatory protein
MPIWRLPAVKAEFGWRSDASAYNSIRAGLLTAGVAIGQRSRGWPDFEVKAIAAARIAGKSDEEIRNLVRVLHARRGETATV